MDQKKILKLLVLRATKEISDVESAELDALLSRNPDALYYEQFIQELWNMPSHNEADIEGPFERHLSKYNDELSFLDSHWEPIHEIPHRAGKRLPYKLVLATVLLTCVVGYFVGYGLLWNGSTEKGNVTIIAEKGIKKEVTLPDGTHIWLNSDSKLSYAANFGKDVNRAVKLEGEAYFDVAKDKRRPFTIATDKITIKVLGTSFNVKAYPNDSEAEATLITGEIELTVNDRPHEKILMKPSEKVQVVDCVKSANEDSINHSPERTLTLKISNLKPVSIENKEYVAETGWIENKLIFRNETLGKIIPQLERWYGIEIKVINSEILENRYTLTITSEDINQLLTAMKLAKPFNYEQQNRNVTIY